MPPWLNKETGRTIVVVLTLIASLFGVDASKGGSADVQAELAELRKEVARVGGDVDQLVAGMKNTDRAVSRLAEEVERQALVLAKVK